MHKAAFLLLTLWAATAFAERTIVVRRIDIVGLHETKRWVVERELRFNVGDTITTRDLNAARDRLSNLTIFNSVDVANDADGIVRIEVPESWPLWPVFSVSLSEAHFKDVFHNPHEFFKRATISLGGTYINSFGTGARSYAVAEFGADEGLDVEYRTRWLSPRIPLAVMLGIAYLHQTSVKAAELDSTRYLRDESYTVNVATRQGAPTQIGLKLKYWQIQAQTGLSNGVFVTDRKFYSTMWFTPYLVLEHRDVEWDPSHGSYAEADLDLVTGNSRFLRSNYDLRGYFPFNSSDRPPLLALRLTGGTSTQATPRWARFYYDFNNALRGFSDLSTEAANYVVGVSEVRVPIGRESTYNVPLIGRYGKHWPWGLTAMAFIERGELGLAGRRSERTGCGAGLYFRIPYFEILQASFTVRPGGRVDLTSATTISF